MQISETSQESLDEIEITLKVRFDEIDKAILEIFNRSPTRTFRVHQIKVILDYRGMNINYGKLARRLSQFSDLSLISKTKSSKVFSYKLLD